MMKELRLIAAPLAILLVFHLVSVADSSRLSAKSRVVSLRDLPTGQQRQAHAFCNVRGKLAVIGGRGRKRSYFYDGSKNKWQDFGFLPQNYSGIHHVQCAAYRNGLILAGGFVNNFPTEMPARDVIYWDLKTEKFMNLGKMPKKRARGSAAIVVRKNKLYVFGGSTLGHGQGKDRSKRWTDVYDPAKNKWKSLRNAKLRRDHHGAAVIGDKAYIAGGRLGGAKDFWKAQFAHKLIEIYNFKSGKWGSVSQKTLGVHPGTAPAACGSLLVIAGGEVDQKTDDIRVRQTEVYNTQQKEWKMRSGGKSQVAQFKPRHATPLATCNQVIYRVAGAQRFPSRRGADQNQQKRQFEALLLDGKVRKCKPSSFWRNVRVKSPKLVRAKLFREAGETAPPLAKNEPGPIVPEVPGMGEETVTGTPMPSEVPSESASPTATE